MNLETGRNEIPAEKKSARNKRVKRKRKRIKSSRALRKLRWLIGLLAVFILIVIAAVTVFLLLAGREKENEAVEETFTQMEESLPSQEIEDDLGDDVVNHIVTAGNSVLEAFRQRPESHELTPDNTSNFASITDCVIDSDTGKISVTAKGDGIPKSDDKYYYLFALNTYQDTISPDSEYIARDYKDNSCTMTAALNYNTAGSRLYKKFVVAVKKDGEYVQVSSSKYITNPEEIAKHTSVYQEPKSIKGLLVDPNKLRGSELDDLGVKQAAYNIPVARLLGPSTNPAYPTINYTYNGKTYTLNGQVIAEYDLVFSTLTAKGITTTAIILNGPTSTYKQLIHPKARGGSAPYYMFNGAEEAGVEYMAAIGSFLADRYSNTKYGKISNWIIANEINARKEWNYMEYTDIETYVEEYAKAFRVFYTAIKSVSGSARVYISLDQQWDRNLKNNTNYDARDVLDVFNANITSKGNLEWGLAQHPYNVPLTEPRIWKASKYVEHNAGTSMMTIANIEVLVNYMKQEQFLQEDGEVRSILISELGYTSTKGEAYQAAAYGYAYYKMEHYKEIDGFLLNRQTDAAEEVAQGLAFGLNDSGGRHKQIYEVFKHIDTSEHAKYTDFAKSIIGISNWSEIMR